MYFSIGLPAIRYKLLTKSSPPSAGFWPAFFKTPFLFIFKRGPASFEEKPQEFVSELDVRLAFLTSPS